MVYQSYKFTIELMKYYCDISRNYFSKLKYRENGKSGFRRKSK